MTPDGASAHIRKVLTQVGHEAPEFAARKILLHVLNLDPAGLLVRGADPLDTAQVAEIERLTARIAGGEPLFRTLGFREFHGLKLSLSKHTLEPRDDSEVLVEAALSFIEHRTATLRLADIGTGTGAIALALLSELPNATMVATDIQGEALQTAQENARTNGLAARFQTCHGSWCDPLEGTFDLIVSNPPYIASAVVDGLDATVRDHDPRLALDGGEDGLDAYRAILVQSHPFLNPGGALVVEIGFDQRESVGALARQCGWTVEGCWQDFGGRDRVLVFRFGI